MAKTWGTSQQDFLAVPDFLVPQQRYPVSALCGQATPSQEPDRCHVVSKDVPCNSSHPNFHRVEIGYSCSPKPIYKQSKAALSHAEAFHWILNVLICLHRYVCLHIHAKGLKLIAVSPLCAVCLFQFRMALENTTVYTVRCVKCQVTVRIDMFSSYPGFGIAN